MNGRDLTEIVEQKVPQQQARTAFKEPGKFKVVLLNDDYTPMPFVVDVLRRFFYMSQETATRVMLEVHFHGRGMCGIFTHDIAETKVALVTDYARSHEYPLLCSLEPEYSV
jgi:ATP-dependent Clp protease adaptor protein ClpS